MENKLDNNDAPESDKKDPSYHLSYAPIHNLTERTAAEKIFKKKRLTESEYKHKNNLKTKRRAKNKIARMSRKINK